MCGLGKSPERLLKDVASCFFKLALQAASSNLCCGVQHTPHPLWQGELATRGLSPREPHSGSSEEVIFQLMFKVDECLWVEWATLAKVAADTQVRSPESFDRRMPHRVRCP